MIRSMHFLSFFLTMILIGLKGKQSSAVQLKGYPHIPSCYKSVDIAISQAKSSGMSIVRAMLIAPMWSDYSERRHKKPLFKYNWTFTWKKLIKEKGKEKEIPIDISKWTSHDKGHPKIIKFPAYILSPGNYILYTEAVQKDPKDQLKPFEDKKCYYSFLGVKPVAVISGGKKRTVPPFDKIVIDGKESQNKNLKKPSSSELKFNWECTQTKKPPGFCKTKPISTKKKWVIPSQYVEKGEKFTVTLTVSTEVGDSDRYTQVIEVMDKNSIVAVISGGKVRSVQSYNKIVLKGSESHYKTAKGETNEGLTYYWNCTQKVKPESFCKKQPVSTKSEFTIPSGLVKEGDKFSVTLTVRTDRGEVASTTQVIEVTHRKTLPPVAIITGGTYRTVASSEDIYLNAEESYNRNFKEKTNAKLTYYWNCTQKLEPTFCKKQPISRKSKFKIPSPYVKSEETFEVTLTVTTDFDDKDSYTQTIEVLSNGANLEITCEKNCPPVSEKSNYEYMTYLSVKCKSNCRNIKPQHYTWTVKREGKIFQFDCEKYTQFGCRGEKLIVHKNVFEAGKYTVVVNLTSSEKHGEAVLLLQFEGPPTVKNCVIKPQKGYTLTTQFRLDCDQTPLIESNTYEIIAQLKSDPSKTKTILKETYPEVFHHTFPLPLSSDYNFKVKISFEGGPSLEFKLDVDVDKKQLSKDLLDNYYGSKDNKNSITNLISSKNASARAQGIRNFQALVEHVTQNKKIPPDLVADLKYKAANDILSAPVTSMNEISQIAGSVTQLMGHDEPKKSDPLLAKYSTTICRKMVEKQMHFLKDKKHPLNFGSEAAKFSNTLQQCLETNTNPNFDAMAPAPLNVTTETSVLAEPIATENYPNYQDFDENYYKNLENLKEVAHNILNGSGMAAKTVAMTTAAGEKFVEIFGQTSATIVAKDNGKRLFKANITSQGVSLRPSPDFRDDEHNYDILLSTWRKDILWWNHGNVKIATNIASLQFWHSTCKERVSRFVQPVRITFKIERDKGVKIITIRETFAVPEGYEDLSGEALSRKIRVRRIVVPKGQLLRIRFFGLPNDSLNVIITKFKFPTAEDFANSSLKMQGNFISLLNDNSSDIWYYVAVLADKNYVKTNSVKSLSYNLSTSLSCCVNWDESESVWHTICEPKSVTKTDIIECNCRNFSVAVFAGYVQNVESQLQELLQVEIEMELNSNRVVFITLVLTVCLYCFLLTVYILKEKNDIYFLGDNVRKHRYAYLIETRTGGVHRSGTTSNITIKLFGDKHNSEPHVLNYPDPEMRLLQKFAHNLFVLTTKHHLGQLEKIELWFDCIGCSPDWFCNEITIYDMQKHVKWYFKVKRRLAVVEGEAHVELTPTLNLQKKINFCGRYHTWRLWHSEEIFGYIKKITIIFSNILSIFLIVLVLYGVPNFQLSDAFEMDYDLDFRVIAVAIVSSFPAFLVHFGIGWLFRFSAILFFKPEKENLLVTFTAATWCLLIVLICASVALVVVLGFWVPYHTSLMWLSSSIVGILLTVVLYETIFEQVQNIFCKLEKKLDLRLKFQHILRIVEVERRVLYQQFGELILRPYLQHLYKPLDSTIIKTKREVLTHRRQVIAELEDLVMFFIYFIVLYVVILANKDNFIVLGKIEMEEMMQGMQTRTSGFGDIGSLKSFYEYVNTTLISSLQPLRWYGNYVISEPAMMVDVSNKFIGILRFRQQRIASNSCTVPELMEFVQKKCEPELSTFNSYSGIFGYALNASTAYLTLSRLRHIWKYSQSYETGSLMTVGEFAIYSGGGYVAYLGRTLYNSYANFREIFKKVWMDYNTRGVFVEFLTYNANYNVFSAVTMRFELSATGYTFNDIRVYSARMLLVKGELGKGGAIFFALFVIWVAILFLKYSLNVVKKIRTFYKDVWLLVDIGIIIMSVTCISSFILRMSMIKKYMDKLETMKHNDFLNYFYLFYLEDILTVFAAILVCVATIRLWKFLRFFVLFRILEKTLSMSILPLFWVTFCLYLIVLGIATPMNLLFGNFFETDNHMVKLMRLLVTMALSTGDLNLSAYVDFKMGIFLISFYGILLKVILVIFVAVILMYYSEAQMEFSSLPEQYNIKHYLIEKMHYLPRYARYKCERLKGGTEAPDEKLQPKDNKFIYTNCYSVEKSRMKTMELVTQCLVRNIKRPKDLTDRDAKLMLSLGQALYSKTEDDDESDVFFKGRIKGRRIALIDEKRIMKSATIVRILLRDSQHEKMYSDGSKEILEYDKCVKYVKKKIKVLKKCDLMLRLIYDKMIDVDVDL